jgi:hypothetical protein
MAFDQKTRNLLQRTVTACRRVFDKEFTAQLQEIYGIQPDGLIAPLSDLEHLGDEQLEVARLLRTRIHHLEGGDPTGALHRSSTTPEFVARVIREQAFTVLNRLAALRLCEERGLVLECVRKDSNSEGFQLFMSSAGNALGETHEAYQEYLLCLFDELSFDLGVLFDRFNPMALLFPRKNALEEVLAELNGSGKVAQSEGLSAEQFAGIWKADEAIGWIYQYYNDPVERKLMRKKQVPENSRELAVRNQFFTPRYVVEFLMDNTLGRIWYEMTEGRTALTENCRYLVRRYDEVFLSEKGDGAMRNRLLHPDPNEFPAFVASNSQPMIELAHCVNGYIRRPLEASTHAWRERFGQEVMHAQLFSEAKTQDILDFLFLECRADKQGGIGKVYEAPWFVAACNEVRRRALATLDAERPQAEQVRQVSFIAPRPQKDPRDLRMLDPACGSMHFGLYTMDLMEQIYREAWEMNVGNLRADHASWEELEREVPRLIIEHNIHGIDIDPRAAQIANLALWLRAQRSWHERAVPVVERPRIRRSNVVCAEPMPGEKELLVQFVEESFPKAERSIFRYLLEQVVQEMQLAGEAGYLLPIEHRIKQMVDKTIELVKKARADQKLFGSEEMEAARRASQQGKDALGAAAESLAEALSRSPKKFFETLEQRIYEALSRYAESADSGGYQRRLFAEDAARGFALIDLCRQYYDVVVMNPPFGEFSKGYKVRAKQDYHNSYNDILAAFVDRAGQLLHPGGRIGAITSRTCFFLSSYTKWREQVVLGMLKPELLVDLGHGVMDAAMVEAAAYVLTKDAA